VRVNSVDDALTDVITAMTGRPGIALVTRIGALDLRRLDLAALAHWIEAEFRVEVEPSLLAAFATVADIADFITVRLRQEPEVR